ncbi:MAG: arylformamidase [Chloroflexota bacterium]|jgi:acetyl esterase/lipase|nr:arylformamidase [Chloroflexota bacterium]
MTRPDAFNNVAYVGAELVATRTEAWASASRVLRADRPEHLDLPYGRGERTTWDLYPASDPAAPCLIHIHGGYWQRGSKEALACVVEGLLAHGWSAALPGYTLAPDATLTQITEELRAALDWFAAHARSHGIAGPVILSGWSAGGHLAAILLDHPTVTAGVAISGVFDLAPLRESHHVNDVVNLTDTEVETLSPIRLPAVPKPLSIAFGLRELPAMMATSRAFHAYRAQVHLAGELIPLSNANHFTILDELRRPGSDLTRAVLRVSRSSVATDDRGA